MLVPGNNKCNEIRKQKVNDNRWWCWVFSYLLIGRSGQQNKYHLVWYLYMVYPMCFTLPFLCSEKTEDDMEREAQLLEWRLTLTEERNAVMVPSAGSGIPGAPAEWYSSFTQTWDVKQPIVNVPDLPVGAIQVEKADIKSAYKNCVFLLSGLLCQGWKRTFPSSSWTLNVRNCVNGISMVNIVIVFCSLI